MKAFSTGAACFFLAASVTGSVEAQEAAPPAEAAAEEPAPAAEPPANEAAPEPTAEEKEALAEVEGKESEKDVADAEHGDSPVELPDQWYYFVGARYRGIVVPKFMINLFAEGGTTVYAHAPGLEFAFRKNGFEYNIGAWLGFYGMDAVALKGADDPVLAWETVESDIKVFYLTSDFLWSHEFSPEFALNYGGALGFGIVFGDLKRNQTYPNDPDNPGDPNTWEKCAAEGDPSIEYCDADNDHYGNYTEPSWANGGSKPLLFPWLALQTGLRFKPSRRFVGRLDLGFGTSGFFFGLGADYGI